METIEEIKMHYKYKTKGHWFSADTMRFFGCRLSKEVYVNMHKPHLHYFVSSEKGPRTDSPRMYSVRCYNSESGDISNIGGFGAYKSLRAAHAAAQKCAKT